MQVTISKSNYTFIDVSSWLDKVGRTYDNAKMTMWDFVMTLAAGIDQFGRSDPKREELFDLAAQQTGLAATTLKTYVSAARSPVASIAIEKDLTFQHARAVLGLAEDVADDLLSQAVAGGWAPERLGHEAWAKKNVLPSPSQRTLTGNTPPPPANEIAPQPGRTLSPPSAYAPRNGYHATDDIDDRAEYLATAPEAYDDEEPPFTDPHSPLYDDPNSHDGYVWDAQGERWRHVDDAPGIDDLWPDERICAMVDSLACDVQYTDEAGDTHDRQYVLAADVCRLLRTMRSEYEALLSRC